MYHTYKITYVYIDTYRCVKLVIWIPNDIFVGDLTGKPGTILMRLFFVPFLYILMYIYIYIYMYIYTYTHV